ncbi:hypothetical protein CYY_001562 [Polysphondylium violaceum]|uniref:Calponin-homology (CH) domain-containing protein n=1 Tax=Polysphondylium violaceum TaxID=133409 RepID=A0A8J4V1I6_9MYCE|nr:hypothetical protein CYY_001562 [Polysphondylium violaceum]
MESSTSSPRGAKELDLSLVTGITIFDDLYEQQRQQRQLELEQQQQESPDVSTANAATTTSSKVDKLDDWMHEYYLSLYGYLNQRSIRLDEFYAETENPEMSPLSREEKKTLENEHNQKESSYLRIKRNTNLKEFEPLFKYGVVPLPKQTLSSNSNRKSGIFNPVDSNNNNNSPFSTPAALPKTVVKKRPTSVPVKGLDFSSVADDVESYEEQGQQDDLPGISITSMLSNNNNNNEVSGGTVYMKKPLFSSSIGMTPPSTPDNSTCSTPAEDTTRFRRAKSISSIVKKKDGTMGIGAEFKNFTPLKTQPVKNKSYTMMFKMDAKSMLEQTEKLLQEKEEDTRIAAEIGQSLLEKNEDLEAELRNLKNKIKDQEALIEQMKSLDDEYEKLQTENRILSSQISTAQHENEQLIDKESVLSSQLNKQHLWLKSENSPLKTKTIKQQKEEIEELKFAVETLQSNQGKLIKNRDRLLSTNEQLQNSVSDLKDKLSGKIDGDEIEKLQTKIKNLRHKNKQLQIQIEQGQLLSPESRAIKHPEVLLKSAFNDLIKNEELISSTPKITNLRVLSDARSLLNRLEANIMNIDDCSLISTLVKFLDEDTKNNLPIFDIHKNIENSISNNNNNINSLVSSLDESFEHDKVNDPRSALYLLICVVSIHKYTRYDKNRIKSVDDDDEFQEERNRMKAEIQDLKNLISELQDNLHVTMNDNVQLKQDLELLNSKQQQEQQETQDKTETDQFPSFADEFKQSFGFINNDLTKELEDEIERHKQELERLKKEHEIQLSNQQLSLGMEFENAKSSLDQTISDYTLEIQQLKDKLVDLDQENCKIIKESKLLEEAIKEKDSQLADYLVQIDNLNESIRSKDSQLLDKDQEIKQYQTTISEKLSEINRKESEIQDKIQHITEKEQLIQSKEKEIERLNNELLSTLKEKENQHASFTSELSSIMTQLQQWQSLCSEKDSIIHEKEQLLSEKDAILAEKSSLLSNFEKEIHLLKDSLQQTTAKLDESNNKVSDLSNQLDQASNDKQLISMKLDESNSKVTDLANQLEESKVSFNEINGKLTDLTNQLEQTTTDKQKLLDQIDETNSKLLELGKENLILLSSIEQIKNQHEIELKSLGQTIETQIETLDQRVQDKFTHTTKSIDDLYVAKENIQAVLESKISQVNQLQSTITQLNTQIKELMTVIQDLKSQHISDKSKSESLILELQSNKEETDSLNTENLQLSTQLSEMRSLLEEKTKKHQAIKRELSMQITDMKAIVDQNKAKEAEEQSIMKQKEEANKVVRPDLEKDYFIEEEKPLVEYINRISYFSSDPDIQHVFPINYEKHISYSLYDGTLLCKLVNYAKEGTIDERVMNIVPANQIEVDQNLNLVTNSARAIGCILSPNISPQVLKTDPAEMIKVLYELVKVSVVSKININRYPNLLVLKDSNEDMKHFVAQSANQILFRWACYHLDIKKSKQTLEQLLFNPNNIIKILQILDKDVAFNPEQENGGSDENSTESKQIDWILKVSVDNFKIFPWISMESILNKNNKLIYLYISSIFQSDKGIGIDQPVSNSVETIKAVEEVLIDVEGTREERAFCMWMNSLNIKPYVNNLQQDLQDGLVILQMFDKIKPGSVSWKEVNMHPSNNYQELENCNLGINIAKSLRFSLVGIDGKDIHDGNRKLTLALIWQACKYHFLSILLNLRKSLASSNSSSAFTEADIIRWANQKVTKSGKSTCMTNFKDQTIGNGSFLIDLLESVQSGVINYNIVKSGETSEEKKLNAQYIINVARKIGCCIFVVWEDLVEVKPKMILTFISTLMCFDQERNNQNT